MEVVEDHPVCRTKKIDSCSGNSTSCRLVSVNRCHIESRAVRRAQPETRCERIPSKLCGMVKCREGRVECKDEVITRVEQVPVEACQFLPQEVCQQVEDSCRTIVRRICRRPNRRRRVVRRRNGEQKEGKGFQGVQRKKVTQTDTT
jgi:hypothetical protein